MFLKNRNIIFKLKKSKVTDYAALIVDFSVGKFISTKRAGKKLTWAEYSRGFDAEREDITRQYKFEEGKMLLF